MLNNDGSVFYNNEQIKKHLQFDKLADLQGHAIETNDFTSLKDIIEFTQIEECNKAVPRDKKDMTVRDFIESYEQGSVFELKATKARLQDSTHSANPSQGQKQD